jgi:hypothetical protein
MAGVILKAERPTAWAGRRIGWRRWRYLGAAGDVGPMVARENPFSTLCQQWRFDYF